MSGPFVTVGDLASLSTGLLKAAGLSGSHAATVTEHLIWADTGGRPNYGVWRLPILTRRLDAGSFETALEPSVERRSAALAIVDGHNAIGHVVASVATDTAMELARDSGVSSVGVRASNFMGALGYYVDRIAREGMVGLVMSNSHPRVAAHGGVTPVLGTNPLAFGAPLPDGRTLIADMATSTTAGGLITRSAELGIPLPEGVAIDRHGQPTVDAADVAAGAMLPLGGAKGFALSLMVEILAGVLTGAGISHDVRSQYKDFERPGDSGHLIVAMHVEHFMPTASFASRMTGLVESVTESGDVRLPGAARWDAWDEAERRGGVDLDGPTATDLEELGARYGVDVPWSTANGASRGEPQ
jgi:ureidoglycolate dehydrogenase (NAD+)